MGSSLLVFALYFVVYPLLTWRAFGRTGADRLAEIARAITPHSRRARRLQAWTGAGTRSWAVTAALLALDTVVAVLVLGDPRNDLVLLATSLLVVITSWTMVVCTFSVAHLRLDADHGGLDFRGATSPSGRTTSTWPCRSARRPPAPTWT